MLLGLVREVRDGGIQSGCGLWSPFKPALCPLLPSAFRPPRPWRTSSIPVLAAVWPLTS